MRVSVHIDGDEELIDALTNLGAVGATEISKALQATGQHVRGKAIKSILKGSKTGVIYERSSGQNLSPIHQASAPGEAPASDTGTLANSIKSILLPSRDTVAVFSQLKYAFWLEFGTRHMDARPFLRPAAEDDKTKKFFRAQLEKALSRAIARAFR